MFRLRQSIVYAIVAFNITMFTLFLQLDLLVFNSPIAKFICWVLTVAAWRLTYVKRHKYFTVM